MSAVDVIRAETGLLFGSRYKGAWLSWTTDRAKAERARELGAHVTAIRATRWSGGEADNARFDSWEVWVAA